MMEGLWTDLAELFGFTRVPSALRAAIVVLICILVLRVSRRAVMRFVTPRASKQTSMLVRRGFSYAIYMVTTIWVLTELGLDPKLLFGAAGVFSVAIGFASQTSASNLISGLFLIGERPFVVGDIITIGETTGEVVSVDLMSVKIRTFANLYVRIPNEAVIKSTVTNLTHYPLRRFDLVFEVDEREDIAALRTLLYDVADRNPLCMDEPRPLILLLGFGTAGLTVQYSIWAAKDNFAELRNTMAEAVKTAFDAHGIRIAYPIRREPVGLPGPTPTEPSE